LYFFYAFFFLPFPSLPFFFFLSSIFIYFYLVCPLSLGWPLDDRLSQLFSVSYFCTSYLLGMECPHQSGPQNRSVWYRERSGLRHTTKLGKPCGVLPVPIAGRTLFTQLFLILTKAFFDVSAFPFFVSCCCLCSPPVHRTSLLSTPCLPSG